VLARSTIVENINSMRKSGLASLVIFYCDFKKDEKRDQRGLLSSVLVQLSHQSDSYSQFLSDFYSEHANGLQQPSDEALVQCLKDILEIPGQAPVYLIVDGLDECSNSSAIPTPREKVLKLLEGLVGSQLSNLRICVTSRPEVDIKEALEPLTSCSVCLHDASGQRKDIDEYIKSVVNTDPKMRKWEATDRELVINVLTKNSDGV
jgi:ankyrin repeat domain-containing protein 50